MHKPLTGLTLILVTISLSLGIFMNVLDVSIANVSIPYIAGDLAVSPDQGTWVITSFAVSQAIMLPLTGWLARRFGEVRLFVLSTFLFTVTSVLCGLSPNLSMLIFFRVLQGAVSGPMIPLSQSLLLSIYPADKKGFATSIWAMVAVVAPICGPILGGWLTYNYSWPWIFYINVPVGMFSVIFTAMILLNRETPITKQPIDIMGLIFLIVGIGTLQVLLDKGNDLDWFRSSTIVALAVVSVISLTFLIAWELTEKHPIIDLSLFKCRNFTIGSVALSLGFLVYFSNIVILPLWLQTEMGYTAIWAGLATAPVGILPFFLSPIIGSNLHRWDPRLVVTIGFIFLAGTSFWCSTFNTDISFQKIIVPRFVQGVGIACFFTPLIMIALSSLEPSRIASASGLSNFLRILGGSFGTSISVSLWSHREQFHHSNLAAAVSNYNPISVEAVKRLNQLGFTNLKAYAQLDNIVSLQAYMLATDDIFWISGMMFLGLLGILWFAKPPFIPKGGAPIAIAE